jgi:hypothetical protein
MQDPRIGYDTSNEGGCMTCDYNKDFCSCYDDNEIEGCMTCDYGRYRCTCDDDNDFLEEFAYQDNDNF